MLSVKSLGWFKRMFRPVGPGSIRGSVFTLFSGSVGAGVLSIPKVMSYYGLSTGIAMILFNSFLAYTSYTSLFKAIIKSGKKRYPNLVNYYLGKKAAKIFALCIISVQFLSVCIFCCIGKFSSFCQRILSLISLKLHTVLNSGIWHNHLTSKIGWGQYGSWKLR